MKSIAVFVVAAVSGLATAQSTYFVTNGSTLYRVAGGGGIDIFDLGDDIVGLAVSGDTIYATSSTASATTGGFELYTLQDAMGTPTLSLITDELVNVYTGISYIDGSLYSSRGGGPALWSVDLSDNSEHFIGNTGLPTGIGGSAYDASTDTYYWSSNADDTLYRVDRSNATAVAIGSLGIDVAQQGLEFFNGNLYLAADNETSGRLELGFVNESTGAYSAFRVVDPTNVTGTVSLAILPSPASAGLLGLGGLLATRRRR